MPVKIRLQRRGRKKRPFYHIVIADARAPRDGRFIEKIGMYNPMTKPATIEVDRDRAYEWLMNGAQPTDTVRAILRFKGVLYRKHLMRGVKKGALTQEEADVKWQEWINEKEAKVTARREEVAAEIAAFHSAVSGTAPVIKPKEIPAVEVDTTEAPAAEEAPAAKEVEEAPAVEAAPEPVAETPAEPEAPAPVVEETPAPAAEADKLTKIEGIGPKIAETLTAAGIATFAQLADSTPEKIKEILDAAEGNFAAHNPATWPDQSKMAAAGEWDKLKTWQDELDGGKPAE